MKLVYFFIFLLTLSMVSAEYEEVLDLPLQNAGELGFYFSKPDVVTENSVFELIVIFEEGQVADGFELQILRNNELLPAEFITPEIYGQPRTGLRWVDQLAEDSTYELQYIPTEGEGWEQEFTITVNPKVVVDRFLEETIYSPNEITQNQKEFLVTLLQDAGYEYSLGLFLEEESRALELAEVQKKVFVETLIYNDNSSETRSVVVLDIQNQDVLYDLKIIETIPKDFANHVDNITFSLEPIVLEEDPVVMWHLEGVEEERLQYSVEGNATLTGNTILLTSVIDEEELENDPTPSRDLWLPILLIPLIALVIIFFSKFNPNKK